MGAGVCVVGSLAMGLVVRAARFPEPGESLIGGAFAKHPGGKGANQAVAAARLGARVALVGAAGDDAWGGELRGLLAAEGIDLEHLLRLPDKPTGAAVFTVIEGGEHQSVVAPGANLGLTPERVEDAAEKIVGAEVLMLSCEVPAESNLRAARIAADSGTRVVLNASPACEVAPELLGLVSLLVVNRAGAAALARCEESEGVSPSGMARRLSARGPRVVAITLGPEGAVLFDGETLLKEPASAVVAVDGVGAIDAFAAALAVAQLEGQRLAEALKLACAAGGRATTVEGAIAAMPARERLEAGPPKGARRS